MKKELRVRCISGYPGRITVVLLSGTESVVRSQTHAEITPYSYCFDLALCKFLCGQMSFSAFYRIFSETYGPLIKKPEDRQATLENNRSYLRGFQPSRNASLYTTPQGMRVRFILRASLADIEWVDKYLAQPRRNRPDFLYDGFKGLHVYDVFPVRLHHHDLVPRDYLTDLPTLTNFSDEHAHVEITETTYPPQVGYERFLRTTGEQCVCYNPHDLGYSCQLVLFYWNNSDLIDDQRRELFETVCDRFRSTSWKTCFLRDLLVAAKHSNQIDSSQPKDAPHADEACGDQIRILKNIAAFAFLETNTPMKAFLELVAWRDTCNFRALRAEIIPYYNLHQGVEAAAPAEAWNNEISESSRAESVPKRFRVEPFNVFYSPNVCPPKGTKVAAWSEYGSLDLLVPASNVFAIGDSGSGKSLAVAYVMARLAAERNFLVVMLNLKKRTVGGQVGPGGTRGVEDLRKLIPIFSGDRIVPDVITGKSAQLEQIIKKYRRRAGFIYIEPSEQWPVEMILEELGRNRGSNYFVCFDELINEELRVEVPKAKRTRETEPWRNQNVVAAFGFVRDCLRELRDRNVYYGIVHQNDVDLFAVFEKEGVDIREMPNRTLLLVRKNPGDKGIGRLKDWLGRGLPDGVSEVVDTKAQKNWHFNAPTPDGRSAWAVVVRSGEFHSRLVKVRIPTDV